MYTTTLVSPVGALTLASDGNALTGLWLADQKYHGAGLPAHTEAKNDLPVFLMTKQWLDSYFAGGKPAVSALPLNPLGSAFRQGVWDILRAIPSGGTTTYGAIAREMAARMGLSGMSAQAVGGAVGHNPISIIIPCHRVLGANGSLTGYAGGVEAKRFLLALEGAVY